MPKRADRSAFQKWGDFAFNPLTAKGRVNERFKSSNPTLRAYLGSSPGPPRHMHGSWHTAHGTQHVALTGNGTMGYVRAAAAQCC